jgi:tetratricopeptide (TPR) repeat protein
VRQALLLLLARLALNERLDDEARAAIAAAEELSSSAAVKAFWSRWYRVRGEDTMALEYLEEAANEAPMDLDVAVELIEKARTQETEDVAMDTARAAIENLPILSDVHSEFGRLVSAPPAEMWTAVAERALRESELDLHIGAVNRAEALTPPDDFVLKATVAELRAKGAAARKLSIADRTDALMQAGTQRVWAGQIELAVEQFDQAQRLSPDDADVSLRLADCLIALTGTQPLSTSRPQIDRALTLIVEVQRRGVINADRSWSYLSEANAREKLAGSLDPDANSQAWRAFLAVCRAVVHDPDAANRWAELASACGPLALYRIAKTAAGHAFDLDPQDEHSIAQYIQALANAGDLNAATERVGDRADPWTQAVRAFILVRSGDPSQAVMSLESIAIDPAWFWASETLIAALLATDSYEKALSEAETLRARTAERPDEFNAQTSAAWSMVVLGDFADAEQLAHQLSAVDDEGDADMILGISLLLQGHGEGGLRCLEEAMRKARTIRAFDDWGFVVAPQLRTLADKHDIELPSLEAIDSLIAERCSDIAALTDPVDEFAEAPMRNPDDTAPALAKLFGTALMRLARGDPTAALEGLVSPAGTEPEDPELAMLEEVLRRRTADPARTDEAAVISPSAETARRADGDDAAIDGAPPGPDGLAPSSEPPLQVLMPSSWFAGSDDPVNDHVLFLRYLPEMRLREGSELPPINVRAEDNLEPHQYRILLRGEVVEEGRVDPSHFYAQKDAPELLGQSIADAAEWDEELQLMRLPADEVASAGGLAQLLTMPAVEVVTRRIAAAVRARTDSLGEGGSESSRTTAPVVQTPADAA